MGFNFLTRDPTHSPCIGSSESPLPSAAGWSALFSFRLAAEQVPPNRGNHVASFSPPRSAAVVLGGCWVHPSSGLTLGGLPSPSGPGVIQETSGTAPASVAVWFPSSEGLGFSLELGWGQSVGARIGQEWRLGEHPSVWPPPDMVRLGSLPLWSSVLETLIESGSSHWREGKVEARRGEEA